MNNCCFRSGTPNDAAAIHGHLKWLEIVFNFRVHLSGMAIAGCPPEDFTVASEYPRNMAFAQTCCRFEKRIEDRFQIEGRAADDLEHVGGGGLLLERFAQFADQTRVLYCDHSLICKCFNELNLLFSKCTWLSALQSKHTDDGSFTYERNTETTAYVDYTPIILKPTAVEVGINQKIRNVNRAPFHYCASEHRPVIRFR